MQAQATKLTSLVAASIHLFLKPESQVMADYNQIRIALFVAGRSRN